MSIVVADGTVLSIATTYSTSYAMSAVTNATEAVATLGAGHGTVVGDFLEITSAWPDLDGRIVRAKTVATNDVTLEGINTADVVRFPAASGTGTVRRITAWTNIAQVMEIDSQGGGQKYFDYQYLNQTQGARIPTSKEPITVAMVLADDIKLAQQATLRTTDSAGLAVACRLAFKNATRIVGNGFWSMDYMPGIKLGEANKRKISIALSSLPTEYAT